MSIYYRHEFVINIKQCFPDFFSKKTVLEFGSHNIHGTMRVHFVDCAYIGVDVATGDCVDVISIAHEYNLPDETFDTVFSIEMFEHDPHWEKSFANMIRLCKKNSLIFFTCATTGRAKHGTLYCDPHASPNTVDLGWEHYKNLTEEDFRNKFNFDELFSTYDFSINRHSFDLNFYGIKK